MSSRQDSVPLVTALQRLLAIIEERPLGILERETSYIIYDFDVNRSTLKPEHEAQLDALIHFLDDHPEAQIVSIIGRASQTGPEPNNEDLTFNRAETVRAYLTQRNISPNRLGPTVASSSQLPIIDAAGSELAINRSVEIICDWKIELVPPSTISSSTLSTRWHIDLGATFGAGALIFAGQVQLGRLTNRTTTKHRTVEAFIAGPELGKSIGPVFSASVGLPGFEEGEFETATPVDFDYFDGRLIAITTVGGSLAVGGSAAKIVFVEGLTDNPSTRFTNIDVGFTIGIGGATLFGFLNVHDE